jgi:hypothetical protein
MDPYLEDPALWPDVHHELISTAREILARQLKPKYSVRVEERVYISDEADPGRQVIVPDLRIVHRGGGSVTGQGTDAAAAVIEPIEVVTLIEEEHHEPRLEVIDRASRAVVAVIEILSPSNKIKGSRSRSSYEEKRLEVMRSPSSFIEVDLLRGMEGFAPHDVLPPHDYRVHVSRASRRPKGTLWPIRLEQRLPRIPVPLLPDDPDSELDLQLMLDTAYDRAIYDQEVDYRSAATPPLSSEQEDWAGRLLRAKGLR